MLIVHYAVKTDSAAETATEASDFERKILDPCGANSARRDLDRYWFEPTVDEDRKVRGLPLAPRWPSRSDPDYAQPTESYYAENGRALPARPASSVKPQAHPTSPTVTFIPRSESACHGTLTIPAKPSNSSATGWGKNSDQGVATRTRWRSVSSTPSSIAPPRGPEQVSENELDSIGKPGSFRAQGRPKRAQQESIRRPSATFGRERREDLEPARKPRRARGGLVLFLMSERDAPQTRQSRCARRRSPLWRDLQAPRAGTRNFKAQKVQFLARRDPRVHQPSRRTTSSSCSLYSRSSSCPPTMNRVDLPA